MPKKLIPVLLILALAGGGWFYYRGQRNERSAEGSLTLYGNVEVRQANLGFRVGGRLARMVFEEGEAVQAGEVMALLDPEPLAEAVRQAEGNLAAARANLAKLESGSRPQEIGQAKARLAEYQAGLASLELEHRRRLGLVDQGAVSRQSLDDIRARRDELKARIQGAREALALAEEGFRAEDIAAGRATLAAAEASLALARSNLADATLTAPHAGTVLTRAEEPGAVVAAGRTVYCLSLDQPVWVRAYLGEPQLGLVHPGMAAQVYTDTHPGRPYPGKVGFVSPEAEFTPKAVQTTELRADLVYRLRVVVANPDQGLRQGMPVTVRLLPAAPGEAARPEPGHAR